MKRRVALVTLIALILNAVGFTRPAFGSTAHPVGPFSCAQAAHQEAPHRDAVTTDREPHNAISYLMVEGKLHEDFAAAATFTLPKVSSNRYFYANWMLLIPFGGKAFVQLNLLRWAMYHFRNEISLTWALPDGHLVYQDTQMFVDDGPHRLEIAVKHGTVLFSVDGKRFCSADERLFFTDPRQRLYFQIGTEASHPGEAVAGTVYDLTLKNDDDPAPRPYNVTCVYRGLGTSWESDRPGHFQAEGVDDPTAPYMNFQGIRDDEPCIYSASENR